MRLFCFPYAGGSAQIFRSWSTQLPPGVEVCPIHLPGRGLRLRDAPYSRLEPLLDRISEALIPQLERPYALFGHSMGAMISYELARRLRDAGVRQPLHLFLSGRRAPHLKDEEPPIHDLPAPEFLNAMYRLGGTDKAILENDELLGLMLPMLRADFELVETYRYLPGEPLDIPITAYGGLLDEEVSREQLAEWRQHTRESFSLHMLPGNHFFLTSAQNQLLRLLSLELTGLLGKLSQG